ncbi:class I SAM-dependent methyltransferase [Humibacillus xanthopallidus]|uniref:class I SAM-dependent methyltransferase n=1 Tax=Humibacillus xanthopallidus TaxID=412689 RepID=UPI001639AFD1|nr:class I SAM-dependent methyltransferase [Humibacillus xanthopallidus]
MNPCPVCASPTRELRLSRTTDREYRLHRCTACGTAWAFPRPTEQDLADFYGAAYFTADTGFGYGDYDGASWAGVQAVRAWDELHEWAPEIEGVSSRRLLDVGAATGEFALRAQADGWEAVACEVGDTAREAARAKGLTAVATIDEAPGAFGVISMYHVLEHLIDPLAVLRLARRAVAPDGYLVIELPQWHSAGRIVRRSAWAQFRPPEHINFFSRRSLATTLGLAGWEVVHSSTPYPHAGRLAVDAARRGRLREAGEQSAKWALGRAGLGGYLRTVARPV